jgi:hypothetical protein
MSGSVSRANPIPMPMATNSPTIRASPRTIAANRMPLIRSARGISLPTPSSMITNRNSTMIAPAYTMIWTTKRNGDPRMRKNTESVKKLTTSHNAEWTALRDRTIPAAAITDTGARIQKAMRSPTP